MAGYVFILGVILVLTPAVMAIIDGVEDELDLATWLAKKPLDFIERVSAMTMGGIGLMLTGACLKYLR